MLKSLGWQYDNIQISTAIATFIGDAPTIFRKRFSNWHRLNFKSLASNVILVFPAPCFIRSIAIPIGSIFTFLFSLEIRKFSITFNLAVSVLALVNCAINVSTFAPNMKLSNGKHWPKSKCIENLRKAPAPVSDNITNNVVVSAELWNILYVSVKPVIHAEPNNIDWPLSM